MCVGLFFFYDYVVVCWSESVHIACVGDLMYAFHYAGSLNYCGTLMQLLQVFVN